VPIESEPNKIPEEALNAFLDGILAELSSPLDPAMLTKVRSIFRKRIPFHMRSYAAALLILRAAGITRVQAPKPIIAPLKPQREPAQPRPPRGPAPAKAPRQGMAPIEPAVAKAPREPVQAKAPPASQGPRKTSEGMVPLFVSMGKRQRLRPQELRSLIGEKTGLTDDDLGRVHLLDNYSFIDVPEIHAEKIIAACDGITFRNRPIEIKPAKKKGENPEEKEQAE
jgi:hypothetical protein